MAKSSKSKTSKSKIDASVTDAVEVTSTDPAADPKAESDETVDSGAAKRDSDLAKNATEAADVPDDENGLNIEDEGDRRSDLDMEIVEDPVEPVEPEVPAVAPQHTNTDRSSGFFPLIAGGLVAGAIGYGVATFFPLFGNSDDVSAKLAAQSEQISALEAQVAGAADVDLSGVEDRIAELDGQTSTRIGEVSESLSGQIEAFDARLSELEKQPNADGTLSDTALAAYQRELEELRAELDAQQETVMSAAARAEADLAAARAEAETLEQEALAAAQAAASRAALNRVATAVETGAPFVDALTDLNAGDVPAALSSAAETGVSTTAELMTTFPAAARAALATARAEGVSDDAGGLGGFFRSQFDVRSTAPQEGSGPDAVLSRAEAAIKEGRVADALAELEALPEVARAEMTDWTARATQRAEVLNAIATLSETYN